MQGRGTGGRTRVLFVLPDIGQPPTKGYQVRCLGIAAGLGERYEVKIISACSSTHTESANADKRVMRRLQSFIARTFDGGPLQSALFDGSDVSERISVIVDEWDPAVVVLVTERLPITMSALCDRSLLVDVVDSMRLHMDERANRARFPLRLVWAREARSFVRVARATRQCATRVIASSSTALADYPDAVIIPNAAPVDLKARPDPTIDVVFTGNLSYWPNVKAARELCESVAPLILADLPNARIAVAGRQPTAAVKRACERSGVSLLQDVEDMSEVLRSSRLAVAPLGWTPAANLKIMEALASGTPVLAYRAAVQHLPERIDGVWRCEGPETMARTAVAILRGEAQHTVARRQEHTWSARAAEMESLLDALLKG